MDGMKKLVITTVAILIAVGIFALMLNITRADIQNQVNENGGIKTSQQSAEGSMEEIPVPDQDYLFFTYSINLYYNSDVSGFFVDNAGIRYDYKLSGNTKELTAEEAFNKAISLKDKLTTSDFLTVSEVANLYNVICDVDPKAECTQDETSQNMHEGTTTVYALKYNKDKPEFLKIYAYGDNPESPKDPNSAAIKKFFMKKLQSEFN